MSLCGIIANYILPYKKATPLILAVEVWLMMLHVGWENPYYSRESCAWLGVAYLPSDSHLAGPTSIYIVKLPDQQDQSKASTTRDVNLIPSII